MTVTELSQLVGAKIVCGNSDSRLQIEKAFASDLMSDVLTVETEKMLLITGLANTQTIRTAEMSDISCIMFVRGRKITPEMITLAGESGITLLECPGSMFKTSGILYGAGIKPVF